MTTSIEFTDRYGGNPPSWLRGCHEDCEAMGVVPGRTAGGEWTFTTCPTCRGSGRCSWLTTVARVPRWLVRGVRTFCEFSPRSDVWTGHPAGYARRAWIAFKVAFLCDLGMRA